MKPTENTVKLARAIIDYHPGVVVKYHSPTNSRGSRVSLEMPDRYVKRKYIGYRHELSNTWEMAQQALEKAGFEVIARTDTKDCHILLVSWPGDELPDLWARIGK